jgi:predicted nucleotide-binding protein
MAKKEFDVFISSASQDASAAKEIATALRKDGVTVWLDEEQIQPGAEFASEIEKSLNSSKAAVILVSDESLRSQWANYEVGLALGRAGRTDFPIIPVLMKGVSIESLPAPLKGRRVVNFSDAKRNIGTLLSEVTSGGKIPGGRQG